MILKSWLSAPTLTLTERRFASDHLSRFPQAGFSMIELLVSVTIMLFLVGGGIASFINFNDRQVIIQGARELQANLRVAQQRAQAGDKPVINCDKLESYQVRATQSPPIVVEVVAVCDTGEEVRTTNTLPDSLTLAEPLDMSFGTLRGGVTNADTVLLTSTTTGLQYQFQVTTGGEITEGGLL